jgi:coenzyme F420-reducing hydrogenase delta subunit
VLRAFESGSSVVTVVACQVDNCHFIEGSRRCARRVDYIRSLLNEIGLGDERLLLFYLPGSASQDLAVAAGKPVAEPNPDLLAGQICCS